MNYREHAVTFGRDGHLTGVVCEPVNRRAGAPAVVVSNVGVNHHVGPYRMWVDLSRALAGLGFVVLRFDLSALGDSSPRLDGGDELARWDADTEDALGLLGGRFGAETFALAGLCSGVDTVHSIAVQDQRVRAAIFLDGYTFPTLRFWLHRYTKRLLDPRVLELALKRRFPSLARGRVPGGRLDDADAIYVRKPITREQFVQDLGTLLDRRVELLFVYTGMLAAQYGYAEQLHDMVRPLHTRGRVVVERHVDADHTFSHLDDRRRLIGSISSFLHARFPEGATRRAG